MKSRFLFSYYKNYYLLYEAYKTQVSFHKIYNNQTLNQYSVTTIKTINDFKMKN